MQESEDYQDNDGKCDGGDKGCQDIVKRINKKKIERILHPTGNNLEVNILAGVSVNAHGYDDGPATVGLLYYSFGVVTDNDGGVQFYYTTKDQTYVLGSSGHMGGYLSGDAEGEYPSDAFGIGLTVSRGLIYGDGFVTDKFLGQGYADSLGVGPASIGKFEPYNKNLNYQGYDLGIGVAGGPVSMGTVATNTEDIGARIQLPQEAIRACQMMGQCGTLFPHSPFGP
jgi:hypothetical protein